MPYATELRKQMHDISMNFPTFEDVLTQSLFALLTREHVLWYSLPGRAKSQVARQIFDLFMGSKVFTMQITKETSKDELFGNILVDELMKSGSEIHNLSNGLADVEFAYLDELFDGNDFLLRTMLNVLNEREFHSKDMGTIKAPLHTVIATTNFLRMREATDAVLDRFMCKAYLHGVVDLADAMRATNTYLSFTGKSVDVPRLDYEGLQELSDRVDLPADQGGVSVSPGMRLLHVLLVREFQEARRVVALQKWHEQYPDAAADPTEVELGIPDISPRTLVKLNDFSRASAVLHNRNEVQVDDLRSFVYGLVTIGDDSGDEQLWAEVCNRMLNLSNRQVQSLERLGEIIDQVGQLAAERSLTTPGQMLVGGRMMSVAQLGSSSVLDKITGNGHPTLTIAKAEIKAAVSSLTATSALGSFDLLKGW